MKSHPCFKLIGQPDSPEQIQNRLGGHLPVDRQFLSVDYTDATNEMFSFASEACVDSLSRSLNLTPSFASLFLSAMTEHQIEDPTHPEVFQAQKRG
jgi:hypothetical protein